MNKFRVHYTSQSELCSYCIVASTTSAAKQEFLRFADEMNIVVDEVTSIEILKENVPATKKQEREAISRIQKILDTLGPQSYVATALEGCLSVAESNIDNDEADSFKKQHSQMSEALDAAYAEIRKKDTIVETLNDQINRGSEGYERTIRDLQAEVHRLASSCLNEAESTFVKSILHSHYADIAVELGQLETRILDTIDSNIDSGVDFRPMVAADLTQRTELKKVLTRIDEIFDKF